MSEITVTPEKPPAHMDEYLEYLDRVEKGEFNIKQKEFADRLGLTSGTVSQAFARCRKYLTKINAEEREAMIFKVNANFMRTALIGTKTRNNIIGRAADNAENDGKLDMGLQGLAEGMVKDTLDRIPETSKKAAEISLMQVSINKIEIPNLMSDTVPDMQGGFGGMFEDQVVDEVKADE